MNCQQALVSLFVLNIVVSAATSKNATVLSDRTWLTGPNTGDASITSGHIEEVERGKGNKAPVINQESTDLHKSKKNSTPSSSSE